MATTRKRKASPPPARDWALTSLKDEEVLADPSLLLSAPIWWPHVYDDDDILGKYPFTVPRAFDILSNRKCELCHKGGIKNPPRSLGLKFGLFAHDGCVEEILTNRKSAGSLTNFDAANAPTHYKEMYNPESRYGKEWTLELVCVDHNLVPTELTVRGLEKKTLAGAKLAGERFRAHIADSRAEITAALITGRAKRQKLAEQTMAQAAVIRQEKAEAEHEASIRREVLQDERAEALAARLKALDALLFKQDSLPLSLALLREKYGEDFIQREDCLGPFLKPIKTSPFPPSKAIAHIQEALANVAAERIAARAAAEALRVATEKARCEAAAVATTLRERVALLDAALAAAGPPLLPTLSELTYRYPNVRHTLREYTSCKYGGEPPPYSPSHAVSLARAVVSAELTRVAAAKEAAEAVATTLRERDNHQNSCVCSATTQAAKACTKRLCGKCCPLYAGACSRHNVG
jgi:hypothetical protein